MVPSWSLVVGADRGSVQVSRKLPSRQDVASSTLVSRSIPNPRRESLMIH
jgi:hypothetical protein